MRARKCANILGLNMVVSTGGGSLVWVDGMIAG